jgi:HSP20 family protein
MALLTEEPMTKTETPEHRKEEMVPLEPFGPGLLANPLAFMRRFAEETDRLFREFGTRRWFTPGLFRVPEKATAWAPNIEVALRKGQLVIRAELPGLTRDDVKVEVLESMLILEGERKQEKEETREDYYTTERTYGAFYRTIPLPEGVRHEEAKAQFRNGVLEITMPAPGLVEKKGHRLEITTA